MNELASDISIDEDVTIVTDLFGSVVSVSGASQELFGYSESDLVGQSIEILIPRALRGSHRDHMTQYARRPHARTMGIGLDLHALHADGSMIPVEVSLRVLAEDEHDLVRAVVRRLEPSSVTTADVSELSARIRQLELTTRDISDVYELVSELASASYGGRPVGIWRFDASQSGYILENVHNLPSSFVGTLVPRNEGGLITQAMFVQGISAGLVDLDDDSSKPRDFFRSIGYSGGIAAAIGGRYEPFGAISVHFGPDDQLGVSDAGDLQTIATEVSRFVLSAMTEETLARESELQAKLAEIGRIFSSSLNVEDIYETFAGLVNELIPHRVITLAEIDHATQVIITRYSINSGGSQIKGFESGTTHPLAGTTSEEMVKTKTGLVINFASPEEFSNSLSGAPGASEGLTGVLNIPLVVSGVVGGTMILNTSGIQTFDDDSLSLGERIGAQNSGSFLSAALTESLDRESTRRGSLNKIGAIVGSNLEFSDIFEEFASIFADAIKCDLVVLTDVDVDANTRVDYLTYGQDVPDMEVGSLRGSITGLAMSSGL